jgi:hypothetical protein
MCDPRWAFRALYRYKGIYCPACRAICQVRYVESECVPSDVEETTRWKIDLTCGTCGSLITSLYANDEQSAALNQGEL